MSEISSKKVLSVLVTVAVLSSVIAGTAAAAVQVSGDFSGTMVGYGDDANTESGDDPNQITVDGSVTVQQEDAVDPTIRVTSGPSTVLDTSSIEALVPSEEAVDLEKRGQEGAVVLVPTSESNRIPAGTTVEITYSVYFKGGTTTDSVNAGTVSMDYESPGGTEGSESFDAETNVQNSPDNEIERLENANSIGGIQEMLSYVGGFAIVVFTIIVLALIVNAILDDEPPGGGSPPAN